MRVIEEHGSERQKKVIALNEYQGNRTLLLSEHFWSKRDQNWRMKKGVSLNTGNYRVMKEALDRENEAAYCGYDSIGKIGIEYNIGDD